VIEKPESQCSQQGVSCKIEVVAIKGVGDYKNDNVQKTKTTYHIKNKRVFPLWVSSRNICLSIFHICD
jgi:hypothetical protein